MFSPTKLSLYILMTILHLHINPLPLHVDLLMVHTCQTWYVLYVMYKKRAVQLCVVQNCQALKFINITCEADRSKEYCNYLYNSQTFKSIIQFAKILKSEHVILICSLYHLAVYLWPLPSKHSINLGKKRNSRLGIQKQKTKNNQKRYTRCFFVWK